MIKTIELDIVIDDERDLTMLEVFCFSDGLEYELINKVGPGGGHPTYKFTGPEDSLKRLVIDLYNHDEEFFNYFAKPIN